MLHWVWTYANLIIYVVTFLFLTELHLFSNTKRNVLHHLLLILINLPFIDVLIFLIILIFRSLQLPEVTVVVLSWSAPPNSSLKPKQAYSRFNYACKWVNPFGGFAEEVAWWSCPCWLMEKNLISLYRVDRWTICLMHLCHTQHSLLWHKLNVCIVSVCTE